MSLRAAWAFGVVACAGVALISGTVFVIATAVGSDRPDQASPARPAAPQPRGRATTPDATQPAERWVRTTARPTGVRRAADPRMLLITYDAPTGAACSRLPRARVPAEAGSSVQVAVTFETVVPLCPAIGRSAVRVRTRTPLRDRAIVVNGVRFGPSVEGTYLRCGPAGCPAPSEHCTDDSLDDAIRGDAPDPGLHRQLVDPRRRRRPHVLPVRRPLAPRPQHPISRLRSRPAPRPRHPAGPLPPPPGPLRAFIGRK